MAERVARAAGPAPMMQTSHRWKMMRKVCCEKKDVVVSAI